ncbi:hypothetical protein Oant_2319 [Brucella anthropi ATCC 49188]|uniref:Uncharacterized protein n=1 Tax=Brucella anthropi (strain ATCC 49188 / DSM 6882 / CCUG 24695 / JCM 21032 / LMG 3331 / NBRC 15819 / NCTC 12168 / Alc 37) TaxID=439375 RepID=A6X1C9_BRUA4|nr:hypothetical protein Oant_2319 [Brucella anthropi ATCC 49188]
MGNGRSWADPPKRLPAMQLAKIVAQFDELFPTHDLPASIDPLDGEAVSLASNLDTKTLQFILRGIKTGPDTGFETTGPAMVSQPLLDE